MKQTKMLLALYAHARKTILEMRGDLERGCKLSTTTAMALVNLQRFGLNPSPHKQRDCTERDFVRICQAIVIAIHFHERPETIAAVGAENAAALRDDFQQLLAAITSAPPFPCLAPESAS